MPNILTNLIVDRVDFVDEGCNTDSYIMICKRKEKENMKLEDILKALPEDQRAIVKEAFSTVTKASEAYKKEVEEIKASLSEVQTELAKAKKEADEDEEKKKKEKMGKSFDETETIKSMPKEAQELFKRITEEASANKLALANVLKEQEKEKIAKRKEALKGLPVDDAVIEKMAAHDDMYETYVDLAKKFEANTDITFGTTGNTTKDTSDCSFESIKKAATEKYKDLIASGKMTNEIAISEYISKDAEGRKRYAKYAEGGRV